MNTALDLDAILAKTRCPICHDRIQYQFDHCKISRSWCANDLCRCAADGFPIRAGVPCLIDFERSVFDREAIRVVPAPRKVSTGWRGTLRRLAEFSEGPPVQTRKACETFLAATRALAQRPDILIVGGGTVGKGAEQLHTDNEVNLVVTDVYISTISTLCCDGHSLPFKNGSFDGVWIQAVLEHVLSPELVVSEIHRVLRQNGVVYAGTPFMQQVHMEAYDFQRFTASGHRWLFRCFDQIDAGVTSGAGRALVWSLQYYFRALLRNDRLWQFFRIGFGWLGRTEVFLDRRRNRDAASGTYFIGSRSDRELTPKEIMDYYKSVVQ